MAMPLIGSGSQWFTRRESAKMIGYNLSKDLLGFGGICLARPMTSGTLSRSASSSTGEVWAAGRLPFPIAC
jgi:hypothetical protein